MKLSKTKSAIYLLLPLLLVVALVALDFARFAL
jgi:hypothetical protein